jgi:hypothetical protein
MVAKKALPISRIAVQGKDRLKLLYCKKLLKHYIVLCPAPSPGTLDLGVLVARPLENVTTRRGNYPISALPRSRSRRSSRATGYY